MDFASFASSLALANPSGPDRDALARDLRDKKRVLIRRGQPCIAVRAMPDLGERVIRFIASTDGIKRDGNRVRNDPGAWDFENFRKNPAMLWCHDYGNQERPPGLPIGSWRHWAVERHGDGNALVMDGQFADHEFADKVYRLYLAEHMRAVSIGWTPLEYREIVEDGRFVGWDFVRNELLECSAVPIPADPDAIMVAAQRGILSSDDVDRFKNWQEPSRGVAYVLDSREAAAPEPAPVTEADALVDHANFWGEVASALPARARAITAAHDRLRGTYMALSDPVQMLCYGFDDEDMVRGCIDRIVSLADDLAAHAQGVADVTLPAPAPEDGAPVYTGTAAAGEARAGKKYAQKRYDKLCGARDCFHQGMSHIEEMISEAEEERKQGGATDEDDDAERKQGGATDEKDDERTAELAELRGRIEAVAARKEMIALKRKIKDLAARKDRLKRFAALALPAE